MSIVVTQGLHKSYGNHTVLHGIDFDIREGRLVGFLGPNGAGKTTTLRILLGLLAAGSGTARVLGKCPGKDGKEIRKQVGYLPGDVHLYPGLTGLATLKHFARVRRQSCDAEIQRLAGLLELPLKRTVRKYSTGMRQKLGLIQALMHQPRLLILDEPTSALDPLMQTRVCQELRRVVGEGRSVLFSSHSLSEVETLCDEVIILREGRIVEQQLIETLRDRALRRVEIIFSDAVPGPAEVPEALQTTRRRGKSLSGTWSGEIKSLLRWLEPLAIEDLIVERPDLNDLFITYYSGNESSDSGNESSVGHNGEDHHV